MFVMTEVQSLIRETVGPIVPKFLADAVKKMEVALRLQSRNALKFWVVVIGLQTKLVTTHARRLRQEVVAVSIPLLASPVKMDFSKMTVRKGSRMGFGVGVLFALTLSTVTSFQISSEHVVMA
tara:strand:- start:1391 stop:1759 length:369 start_codon:yes stop_codon:yes gene_type:complete